MDADSEYFLRFVNMCLVCIFCAVALFCCKRSGQSCAVCLQNDQCGLVIPVIPVIPVLPVLPL